MSWTSQQSNKVIAFFYIKSLLFPSEGIYVVWITTHKQLKIKFFLGKLCPIFDLEWVQYDFYLYLILS